MEPRSILLRVPSPEFLFNYTQIILFLKSSTFLVSYSCTL